MSQEKSKKSINNQITVTLSEEEIKGIEKLLGSYRISRGELGRALVRLGIEGLKRDFRSLTDKIARNEVLRCASIVSEVNFD